MLLFLPPAVIVIGVAGYYNQSAKEKSFTAVSSHESAAVAIGSIAIQHSLETLKGDLLYLSRNHDFHLFLEKRLDECHAHFSEDYKNMMLANRSYDQIRWIDENGMEKMRINYNGGNPLMVPDENLQYKGDRYYFYESVNLPQSAIYLSPFDLNIDHDKVEVPYKPVLRIATPLIDSHGDRKGIFIINYLGTELIERNRRNTALSMGHSMLVNSDGYWLMGARGEDEWGFMRQRKDLTMRHRYPHAWKHIGNEEAGQFVDADGLWTFKTVHPLKQEDDRAASEPYRWKAVTFVPTDKLYESSRENVQSLLIIGTLALIGAGLGSWGLVYLYRRKEESAWAFAELQKKRREYCFPSLISSCRWITTNATSGPIPRGSSFSGKRSLAKRLLSISKGNRIPMPISIP